MCKSSLNMHYFRQHIHGRSQLPILFLIYSEMMMIDAMEEIEDGIKVRGKLAKDVRFADDQGMIAALEGGLQN